MKHQGAMRSPTLPSWAMDPAKVANRSCAIAHAAAREHIGGRALRPPGIASSMSSIDCALVAARAAPTPRARAAALTRVVAHAAIAIQQLESDL